MSYKHLHSRAMEFYEQYSLSKISDPKQSLRYLFEAYTYEKKAALDYIKEINLEPNRTILLKKAASFAYQLRYFDEAKELIQLALEGEPAYNHLKDLMQLQSLLNNAIDIQ